ncbi:MAG: methyltransferase family protein [Candidatus Thorarchaeota archaeon]
MVDLSIAGPIVGTLAGIDVALHLYMDYKKTQLTQAANFREPSVHISRSAMVAVAVSTLLSFLLVGLIPLAWIFQIMNPSMGFFFTILDLPYIWLIGLVFLSCGIFLHGWSRYVRHEMATSWAMTEEQRLITSGPYSKIRHPSYSSYFLCFIGLWILLPSLVSLVTLVGFWGYNKVAVIEEEHLLNHFGGAYREYMKRTGRFFPGL